MEQEQPRALARAQRLAVDRRPCRPRPTLKAALVRTVPLTATRPAAIQASASRREQRPARAMTLAMRSPCLFSRRRRARNGAPGFMCPGLPGRPVARRSWRLIAEPEAKAKGSAVRFATEQSLPAAIQWPRLSMRRARRRPRRDAGRRGDRARRARSSPGPATALWPKDPTAHAEMLAIRAAGAEPSARSGSSAATSM